jgi:hypothetical protein
MIWDKAVWRGPPDPTNYGGSMVECRGLVLHIAEGTYEGTIGWMKNPTSDVSAHFVIGLGGEVAQMLDTSVTAWTQGAGNGHWVSVENAGFHTGQFTPAQIEANAALMAWLMATHGVKATIATGPNGYGLGHHGMGGAAWGNHPLCPGPANVALKPQILARAIAINKPPEDDMGFLARDTQNRMVIITDDWAGWFRPTGQDTPALIDQAIKDRSYWRSRMGLPAEKWVSEDGATQTKFSFGDDRTSAVFGPDLGAVASGAPAPGLVQHTHDVARTGPAERTA